MKNYHVKIMFWGQNGPNGQKYIFLPQNCVVKLLIHTKLHVILRKLALSFILRQKALK